MRKTTTPMFRLLFIESPTGWTAVDIDHGFSAQGKKFIEVWHNIKKCVKESIEFSIAQNQDWKACTKPASESFHRMYEQGKASR